MSWLTVVWSMAAGVCGTIAVVHLGIWLGRREQPAHLPFALGALAAGLNALAELAMFSARDVESYAVALRVSLVAISLLIGFTLRYGWVYFGNGRRLLLEATTAAWAVVALLAIVLPLGPVFSRIDGLREVETFWGERFAVAIGEVGPWHAALSIADLLLVAFLIDAAAMQWRRDRRWGPVAVRVGFLVLLAGAVVQARLVDSGALAMPYLVTFVYMSVVMALGYPLSREALQVTALSRRLAETEAGLLSQRNELAHLSRVAVAGELSASLAHELNQPLAAILSNAQAGLRLLAREPFDREEIAAILADIVDDDKRAGEVIRRLRELLRKGELRCDPLDFNELLIDALRILRNDLLLQGVTVAYELGDDLPRVDGDRVQLQQVVLNLVVNASDAMAGQPASERRLTLVTRRGSSGIELLVRDRGPGIPAGELETVFTPFHTTKSQGMGLGLAVCRTIVEAHGGRIRAIAEPGSGATFLVTLPESGSRSGAIARPRLGPT